MKYILYFLSLSVFVLVGALTGASPAKAVSPYDDMIRLSEHATISSTNNEICTPKNFDFTWPNMFGDEFNGTVNSTTDNDIPYFWGGNPSTQIGLPEPYSDIKTSFDNKQRWGVTYSSNGDLIFWWTSDPNAKGVFQNPDYGINYKQLTLYSSHTSYFANATWYRSGGQCYIDIYNVSKDAPNYNSREIWATYDGSGTQGGIYFAYLDTIEYPSAYDGEIIPDIPPTPGEVIDTAPNWYVSNIIANVGTFHDKNFNTFDANPFLCEGGLAPILNYEIFRIADGQPDRLLTSGYQSATAQIIYNFGEADTDRNILLVGWYDCGDGTIFPNQGRYEFTVNRAGLLKIDLFEACVFETWPFVDANACLNNLYTVINLFYFGKVALPNFSFDTSCRNLTTMDDWLGLPNGYQVCPQVPEFVRTVTTPFVAFMLGLITLGFIKRIRTEFDG